MGQSTLTVKMVNCKWVIILTLHYVTGLTGLSWIHHPAFNRQPRHVIGRVHTHGPGDSHDTGAAIQTILSSLGKQNNETKFTCEEEGSFPHPLLCTKYYLCEEDLEPREYECFYDLTGLLFDAVTRSCVWAAKAKCFTEEDSIFQAVEAEYEPDFECKKNGRVPDPDYCMRYFECDKRLGPRLEYCATGTFYDIGKKKCLWASGVSCGERRDVETSF